MSDDVRLFYDELAADYDAIFADWDASVRRQGNVLAALLGDVEGPILDVAAGMAIERCASSRCASSPTALG
jgi:glycine/sarcosine N-methyltransferase